MKKNHPIIDMLLGIVMALAAASIYSIIISWNTLDSHKPEDVAALFIFVPLYALLYTFWFVIPMGAALGIAIPEAVRNKSRWMGALLGAALGLVAGLMIGLLLALISLGSVNILLSLTVYCIVWTGVYGAIRARGAYHFR